MNQEDRMIEHIIESERCEMCGGEFVFDPLMGQVKCSFCGHLKPLVKTTKQVEKINVLDMSQYSYDWEVKETVIVCQSCGGKFLAGINDMTSTCIYCGSHHVIHNDKGDLGLRPKAIIPFKLNEDHAMAIFKQWLAKEKTLKHTHVPQKIIKENRFQPMKAVYMPFWSFDVTSHLTWHQHLEQEEGQIDLMGDHHRIGSFSDDHINQMILVVKSKFSAYLDWIDDYDYDKLVDYAPEYLQGFYAEKYNVMPEDAFNQALEAIYKGYEAMGYKETRDSWSFVDFDDMKFNLYLLPVYFTSFWHKGDLYFVVINGQTGTIHGGLATKVKKKKVKPRRRVMSVFGLLFIIAVIGIQAFDALQVFQMSLDQMILMAIGIGALGGVIALVLSKGYL